MSDGTKLSTIVSFPSGILTSFPVIFQRSPYGEHNLRFFFELSYYGLYLCFSKLSWKV